jgi:hypothetical protein
MKARDIAVVALLGAGAAAGCAVYETPVTPRPAAEVEVHYSNPATVDIGFFYDDLGSYGEWIERPTYGRVWIPSGVRAGWRPYAYGRWVHSDYGWTWISEEPFGWATYHYGRWFLDPEFGWSWVPGREWGPAWVAWQHGGGYIGWAPLPPAVGFRAGVGLDFGAVNVSVDIAPHAYAFVEERVFLEPHLTTVIVPPARNVTIIHNTTNVTNYTVINNRIVNQSVDVQRVEQVTGKKVEHYQVTDLKSTDRQRSARIQGNQIALYRPAVKQSQSQPAIPPAQAKAEESKPKSAPATPRATPAATDRATAAGQPSQPSPKVRVQPVPSPEELDRRHAAEKRDLDAYHAAESKRLADLHQRELNDHKSQQNADELKRRHQDELRALAEQHKRDQQQLEARHQREKQAAQAAQKGKEKKNKKGQKAN